MGLGSSFLDNPQGLITLKIYQDDAYKAKAMDEEAEHFRKITMKVLTMQLNSVSLMDLLCLRWCCNRDFNSSVAIPRQSINRIRCHFIYSTFF